MATKKWFMAVHGNDVIASGTTVAMTAGAITVADTTVTAGRKVRLYTAAPAGTPGALFVSAITPGTSFQIKSSSSSDTSTVFYEVVAL